jgi:hypothetical protein
MRVTKVTKKQIDNIIHQYKDRYIDFNAQKESSPDYVVFQYVYWLFDEWNRGMINLSEYRKLIAIDILSV